MPCCQEGFKEFKSVFIAVMSVHVGNQGGQRVCVSCHCLRNTRSVLLSFFTSRVIITGSRRLYSTLTSLAAC